MEKSRKKITFQFLGAAGTVTGSKYLITTPAKKIMVDCGLFQGVKELRSMNWDNLPIDVSVIDVVLLTHGHLDHVGYLPRLVKCGFKGKIMATAPTIAVAKVILKDSARIQEEDAENANKQGYSKHHPALPLYDMKDVERTIPLFNPQTEDIWVEIDEHIKVRYRNNGHIIGSTFIELIVDGKWLVFSGDVGRGNDPLMQTPDKPLKADVLFIESTYGDRFHPANAQEKLKEIITTALENNGTIIIPGFAVERIQLLMFLIWQLKSHNLIPDIPVYMDSPMGASVLDIFIHNRKWHKISVNDFKEMCNDIIIIEDIKDTLKVASSNKPKIVIAGSGMVTGGRVLTYLQYYITDPSATILLVGYQAEGTRGRALLEGEKKIKFYGKYYTVKAKIESIDGFSAHADQNELIDWLSEIKTQPEKIFIVHGEENGRVALQKRLKQEFSWESVLPELNQEIDIFL